MDTSESASAAQQRDCVPLPVCVRRARARTENDACYNEVLWYV